MRKLITILLVLFAVQGFGQVYQTDKTHGRQYYRLKADSTLHIPTFCGVPTLRSSVIGNQAAIAMDSCNNRLYFYNPKDSSWNIVGSGGVIIGGDGVDSVTYSSNELCQWVDGESTCYRLNKFFDSTSTVDGKIYYYNNGTLRDSVDMSDTLYNKYPLQTIADTLKLRTDSMPNMIIAGDTTDMPGNGVPTLDMVNARMGGGGGGTTDTSHLSDRINLKLNISDTAAMLLPYHSKIDSIKIVSNSYQDSVFARKNGTFILQYVKSKLNTPAQLTDGSTITWDCKASLNDSVTLGGNRTLAITNSVAGMYGTLVVKQDATGSRTLTLPSGSKVISGGSGAVTLSTAAGAKDLLTFYYDGTFYYWTYGKNYN